MFNYDSVQQEICYYYSDGHVSLCNAHLIHNHHVNFIHFGYALFYQVQNSSRCCYYNMNCRKEFWTTCFYCRRWSHCCYLFTMIRYILHDYWALPVSSRRMISSRRLVPPVVAMTLTPPRCLLIWILIWLTCRANSRVGTITMAAGKQKDSTVKKINRGLKKKVYPV